MQPPSETPSQQREHHNPPVPAKTTLCGQCPWRRSNHGRRSKGGFYRKDNLRRLWNQIRNGGGQQSCHLTDPSHPDHQAAGAPEDAQPQECPGSLVLIQREIRRMRLTAGGPEAEITPEALNRYLKDNPRGISRRGTIYWLVQRLHLGGTPIIGGPAMPKMDQSLLDDEETIARLE